jgi:general secretion pathway protein J
MTSVTAEGGATEGDAGFTLVEMLVALALTALLSGLLVASLAQLRPLRLMTQASEAESELAAVGVYLDNLVSDARDLPLMGGDPNGKATFEGSPQRIRFVAVPRSGSSHSALRDVEVFVREANGRFEVHQRNERRRLIARDGVDVFVVAAGLQEVRFQYLGARREKEARRWTDEWPGSQGLPHAVKIILSSSSRHQVLETIAILRAARP